MMKPKLSYLLFFVSLICQPLLAEPAVRFTLNPFISYNLGYTEYIMDYDIYVPEAGASYMLKSELEFPLDVVMAGVKIGLHSMKDTLYAWSIEAGYFTNIDDPGGIMKDHDWETAWGIEGPDTVIYWGQVEKFSYTESDAEMKSTQLSVEGLLCVLHKKGFALDLWGGFRYQKISQEIVGYDGWQLWRDSNGVQRIDVAGTEPAIDYWVSYKSPFVGLRTGIRLVSQVSLETKAAFAPVWVSDLDDHLLRFKKATADMTGSGVISGASVQFDLGGKANLKPSVIMFSDLVYFHASGNQTQEWYGDDEATPDVDDTGTTISGIPHEINTFQLNVGLRVVMIF